jgi:hypothetical protein
VVARAKLLSVGTFGSRHGVLCREQKWTATSALIFNAVLIVNRPWAQRRAVAAKGDLGG